MLCCHEGGGALDLPLPRLVVLEGSVLLRFQTQDQTRVKMRAGVVWQQA